jgi:hypothetical protein
MVVEGGSVVGVFAEAATMTGGGRRCPLRRADFGSRLSAVLGAA